MEQTILEVGVLVESEGNYRQTMDKKGLKELEGSIRERGVLQPLIVRPMGEQYEVVAGHRRFTAGKNAGLTSFPVVVKEMTDEEAFEVQFTENCQREDVNPMEEAAGFERLLESGDHYTPETIAEKIGRPLAYVHGRLKLLDIPKAAQKALLKGEITYSHALVLTRLGNKDEQKALFKAMVEGEGMTAKASLATLAQKFAKGLDAALFDTDGCASCPSRSINQGVLFKDPKGVDACLDKSCYHAKEKDHYEKLVDDLKDEGFKILTREEATKYAAYDCKTAQQISPVKNHNHPKRYKGECMKCLDSHAFYLHESTNWNGPTIELKEFCLNKKCFETMQYGGALNGGMGSAPSAGTGPSEYSLKEKATSCRDRFLQQVTPERVDESEVIQKRLNLYQMLDRFGYYNGAGAMSRDSILKDICPPELWKARKFTGSDLYLLISAVPAEELDGLIKRAVLLTIPYTPAKVLLHMMSEAGLSVQADFRMDKLYLNTKTKADLIALVAELGLEAEVTDKMKKSEILEAILKLDLTGKTTSHIGTSFALTELKDISDPVDYSYRSEEEDEEDEAA